jgi:hypothetical protein
MSSMQFACPFCANLFEVDVEYIGQHVACPTCAGVVLIPEAHPLGESVPLGPAPPPFIQETPEIPPLIHNHSTAKSEVKSNGPDNAPFDIESEAARLAAARKRAQQEHSSQHLWNAFWIVLSVILLVLMAWILIRSR